jgi:hypothetical protein
MGASFQPGIRDNLVFGSGRDTDYSYFCAYLLLYWGESGIGLANGRERALLAFRGAGNGEN